MIEGWRCAGRRRGSRRSTGRSARWQTRAGGRRRRTRWCGGSSPVGPWAGGVGAHDPDVYRDDFELVLRRESADPNDIWQADHTELDVMVLDERGKPARPWLTVILDDHSRAVAGYTVFLGDPTALQTALALRQAIWRKTDPAWPVCGLPAVLYSDHGADFTSDHIAQVCADVKVQLIHSTPGKPRGRGKVERLFGTITTELLPTLPGHIPPGNHGKPVTPPALTLSQLDAAVGRYIVDNYHHRVHPETGQTPAARWAAGGWLPRMPDSLGGAGPAAADRGHTAEGATRRHPLYGLRYFSITLAAYVGEPVTIRYDPRDLAEIRVYHHEVPVPGRVPGDRRDQHLRYRRLPPIPLHGLGLCMAYYWERAGLGGTGNHAGWMADRVLVPAFLTQRVTGTGGCLSSPRLWWRRDPLSVPFTADVV